MWCHIVWYKLICADDGRTRFLWNVGTFVRDNIVSHPIRQQFFIADTVGINAATCTNNEYCTVHYLKHCLLISLYLPDYKSSNIRKLILGRNRGSCVHTFAMLQALSFAIAIAKIGSTNYILHAIINGWYTEQICSHERDGWYNMRCNIKP